MHRDKIRHHSATSSAASSVSFSSFEESSLALSHSISPCPIIHTIAQLNNEGVALLQKELIGNAMHRFRRALQKVSNCNCEAIGMISSFPQHLKDTAVFSSPLATNHSDDDDKSFAAKKLYIFQREEYDEGMDLYNDPIAIETTTSTLSSLMVTLLYNIGLTTVRLGDDEDALAYFSEAFSISEGRGRVETKTSGTVASNDVVLAILHNLSRIEYRNGRYEEAIRYAAKSLAYARRGSEKEVASFNPNSLHQVAQILNSLGVLTFHMPGGDTSYAMTLYQESLSIRKTILDASPSPTVSSAIGRDIATTLNNIGRVHYMRGEHDQALQVYYEALQMRKQLLSNDHLDVAATIYNVGQTHHQRGDLDQAMTLYNEFLTIARCRLGEYHRDVAIMLKCIAQIHHEKGEFETAKQTYKDALRIGRSALGKNHPEVASTLNKLGNLLYETKDFQGAIRVYQEGLEVERAVLDVCHPNIVVTLTNIGQIYKLRGEHHAALQVYKEAAAIQQNTLGPNHPSTAATLASIALIYFQTKAYSQALDVYQETLRIRRDAYEDDNLEVAASLNSIGLVLFKMELHDMALQSFFHSLEIRRKKLGDIHRDVAVILYNIATVYLEMGDEEDAVRFYRDTLRVEQASLGKGHRDVLLTMQHIGQVHQQRGEIVEALSYFQESLKIQLESPHRDPIHLALTYNQIGNLYLQRGDTGNMVHAYSEALRLLRGLGKTERDMNINGINFYGLSKMHPECAACA